MKSYQKIFIFLLLVLLLTVIVSPWAALLWNSFLEARPQWQGYRPSFSHIFGRLFMILGAILFFPCRSLLKIQSWSQIGLKPFRRGYQDWLRGFLIALASVIFVALFMSLLDIFDPYFRLSLSVALERSVKALLAAFTLGLLEEIFFRGILFKGLLEDLGCKGAFFLTSFFYSAIHFIKPAKRAALDSLDPWAGLDHLIYSFQPFLDPTAILPGFLGLFLIGLVLSSAYLRTGSLYLSIGLHAGWVFGLKSIRVYGDFRREDLGWLFGSSEPKIVSGIVGWIVIVAVGVFIHWITRKRQRLPLNP